MTQAAALSIAEHDVVPHSGAEPEPPPTPAGAASTTRPPTPPSDADVADAVAFARKHVEHTRLRHHDASDLLEAALYAIAEAAHYWRPARGAFGPYARTCIRRAVWRAFNPDPRARRDVLDEGRAPLDALKPVREGDGVHRQQWVPNNLDVESLLIAAETIAAAPDPPVHSMRGAPKQVAA